MSATAQKAIGTLIKRGNQDGPPETFTAIGRAHNFQGPNLTTTEIDVTGLDNTTGYKDILMALKDAGQITMEIFFDPGDSGHRGVLHDYDHQTLRNWDLIFPDPGATTWSAACYVKDFVPKGDTNGALTAQVTLRVSGAPTLVEA
jgi:predicted secreted protein